AADLEGQRVDHGRVAVAFGELADIEEQLGHGTACGVTTPSNVLETLAFDCMYFGMRWRAVLEQRSEPTTHRSELPFPSRPATPTGCVDRVPDGFRLHRCIGGEPF